MILVGRGVFEWYNVLGLKLLAGILVIQGGCLIGGGLVAASVVSF